MIDEVERSPRYLALPGPQLDRGESTFATAVAKACVAAADQLGIGTICVYTRSGETARQVAEYRPRARIVAFTASLEAYRRMALHWGVNARLVPRGFESTDDMISSMAQTLVGTGEAMRGEAIVIASAVPSNRPTFGASMMQIHCLQPASARRCRSGRDRHRSRRFLFYRAADLPHFSATRDAPR